MKLDHPLSGIGAKLERAYQHIEQLDTEIDQFLSTDPPPYFIESGFYDDPCKYEFKGFIRSDIPLRFSVMAGEIVHQLRSSLDHLITALVLANNQPPIRNLQFPIARDREKFKRACDGAQVKGVSKSAFRKIVRLQPYRSSTPQDMTIFAIHDLNIRDKHSLLLVTGQAANIGKEMKVGSEIENTEIVKLGVPGYHVMTREGVEVFSITLGSPVPDFKAETDFSFQVCLANFGAGNPVPLMPTLVKMWEFTRVTVNSFSDQW